MKEKIKSKESLTACTIFTCVNSVTRFFNLKCVSLYFGVQVVNKLMRMSSFLSNKSISVKWFVRNRRPTNKITKFSRTGKAILIFSIYEKNLVIVKMTINDKNYILFLYFWCIMLIKIYLQASLLAYNQK